MHKIKKAIHNIPMEIKINYKIYELRVKKNMSARQLAMLAGISHTEINNIESGKKHPSLVTLCKIATALKTEPSELYTYNVEKSGN